MNPFTDRHTPEGSSAGEILGTQDVFSFFFFLGGGGVLLYYGYYSNYSIILNYNYYSHVRDTRGSARLEFELNSLWRFGVKG